MKVRGFVSAVIVAGLIGFLAGSGFSEDTKGAPSEKEMAEMMEMIKKLGTPGEEHKKLEAMIGEWDVVSKMWMGPGEPQVSKATSKNVSFLGGRFVMQDYKGTWMGQPFTGVGLMGYDNFKKQHVGMWLDSWSTGISTQTGSRDGDAITMNGVWEGPQGTMKMRMVHKFVDKDNMVMTGYMLQGENEMKHMELTYTRKKTVATTPASVPNGGWVCPKPNKGPGY